MSMRGVNSILVIYKFCKKSKPARDAVHDFIMHRDYKEYSDSTYFIHTREDIDEFLGHLLGWVAHSNTFDNENDAVTVIEPTMETVHNLYNDEEEGLMWESSSLG